MRSVCIFLLALCALVASASAFSELDRFDLGNLTSEFGHNVSGWSSPDWNTAGCYGGGDDQTFRTVFPRSSECLTDDKTAYFSFDTEGYANELRLRHLLGSQSDAYLLYIKINGAWVLLNASSSTNQVCGACNTQECWYTDAFSFPDQTGKVEFRIVALNVPESWCSDWGLNAFSWAQLWGAPSNGGSNPVPEFGTIATMVGLAGAVTAYFVIRKQ
ncbi:MAG: hypothetical protein V1837_04630 [Candidatus Woesearchaeota archaeon]